MSITSDVTGLRLATCFLDKSLRGDNALLLTYTRAPGQCSGAWEWAKVNFLCGL